ncbi:hypothetical protein POPTR_008G070501v4 [Populus trichocarpa]|uniref:Uncharacterized protein n=1 Tax=Populus trichocarpa TaxID=3694 RepID=A0ACC0SK88_POPTR|nr:hypothetical protein BDE02_08G063300 [Populus trichocarpa]KAI9389622.1 hypothetical protein POPTR_008G070501v4 [Populus trichocarpa]
MTCRKSFSPSAILFFLQVNFVRFMLEPTPVQSILILPSTLEPLMLDNNLRSVN